MANTCPRTFKCTREYCTSVRLRSIPSGQYLRKNTGFRRNHEIGSAAAHRQNGGRLCEKDIPIRRVDAIDASVEPRRRESVGSRHGDDGRHLRVGEQRRAHDAAHGVTHNDNGRVWWIQREDVVDGTERVRSLRVECRAVEGGQVLIEFDWTTPSMSRVYARRHYDNLPAKTSSAFKGFPRNSNATSWGFE